MLIRFLLHLLRCQKRYLKCNGFAPRIWKFGYHEASTDYKKQFSSPVVCTLHTPLVAANLDGGRYQQLVICYVQFHLCE